MLRQALRTTRAVWVLTGLLFLLFSAPGLRAQEASEQVSNLAGKVLTVNGPVDPGSLGATMAHEHIFINRNHPNQPAPTEASRVRFYLKPLAMDMLGAVTMGYPNRDNLILGDELTAVEELTDYRKRGGGTLVDVTSIGLGRDPAALRRVSRTTGVHVVMGTGWDIRAVNVGDLEKRSLDDLTRELVQDVTSGLGSGGIRSGIIGEVATAGNPLTSIDIKLVRTAGRASRITGAPVSLHSGGFGSESTHAMLDLLEEEDTDLGPGHPRPLRQPGSGPSLPDRTPEAGGLRGIRRDFGIPHAAPTGDGGARRGRYRETDPARLPGADPSLPERGPEDRPQGLRRDGLHLRPGAVCSPPRGERVTDEQIRTLIYENPQRILTFAAPGAAAFQPPN